MGNFQRLRVWMLSKDLAVEIYKVVDETTALSKDLRFRNQIVSSVISIPSNIAEGDESNTLKQSINYFYIAKGSCAELITQLIIIKELELISKEKVVQLIQKTNLISYMLFKLIVKRKNQISTTIP